MYGMNGPLYLMKLGAEVVVTEGMCRGGGQSPPPLIMSISTILYHLIPQFTSTGLRSRKWAGGLRQLHACHFLNPSSTSHAERSCLSSVSDGCGQYLPYKAGGDRYTTSACMHAVTLSSVTLSPSVLTR